MGGGGGGGGSPKRSRTGDPYLKLSKNGLFTFTFTKFLEWGIISLIKHTKIGWYIMVMQSFSKMVSKFGNLGGAYPPKTYPSPFPLPPPRNIIPLFKCNTLGDLLIISVQEWGGGLL